jgi:hypothetical protein
MLLPLWVINEICDAPGPATGKVEIHLQYHNGGVSAIQIMTGEPIKHAPVARSRPS